MPSQKRMQSELRKVYKSLKILLPIKSDNYFQFSLKSDKSQSLTSLCNKKLPWNLSEALSAESSLKLCDFRTTSKFIEKSSNSYNIPPLFYADNKYRTLDAKKFDLKVEDFSMEYTYKIKKLKYYQTILSGQSDLIVNDKKYLEKIKEEIDKRQIRAENERMTQLKSKEVIRERMFFKDELFNEQILALNNPLRKIITLPPIIDHQEISSLKDDVSDISSTSTSDSWGSINTLFKTGVKHIRSELVERIVAPKEKVKVVTEEEIEDIPMKRIPSKKSEQVEKVNTRCGRKIMKIKK